MKAYISIAMLAALSACGGTSIPTTLVESSLEVAAAPAQIQTIAQTPDRIGDVSFAGLLNAERGANNAGMVTYNSQLDLAAQNHADDMLENDYFSHTGLNGSTVATRVLATGYDYARVGENIASGYQTEESVLQGWIDSPGHQRNNIDPNFEEFGLGLARDGRRTRWVLVLGTER